MNMYATHPIRVVLFWDSEHARDAFSHYFTGATKKTWTFTLMVTHDQLDPNQWHFIQNKHRMTLKFISKLTSHLVANDLEILVSNVIQEVQVLLQTGCMYKRAWYAQKFAVERMFGSWKTTFSTLSKHFQAMKDSNPRTMVVRKLELVPQTSMGKCFQGSAGTEVNRNIEAYNYLVKISLKKWTLLDDGGHRHRVMTTNISKELNSVLKKLGSYL
ncbi:hypothetical protein M9H77_04552 [Catharanthus roseus]|uniref:Uncharacterized protein n=1 Tax=Catharanthus roseus TaxID=4058 RepID=A0ACC0CEV8_CATRO|nr:hypothetical protein M9H77_04552 [Catharanthus roseus]